MDKIDQALRSWITSQLDADGMSSFLNAVREKRDGYACEAFRAGDTDFMKGQVAALDWLLDLPEEIVTTETEAEDTGIDT